MIRYAKRLPEEIVLVSPTRVRKVTVTSQVDILDFMQRLVIHFMSTQDPSVVPVYSFELLKVDNKGYQVDYVYAYEMERLGELTRTEQKIIDLVGDAQSAGKSKPLEFSNSVENANLLLLGWEKFPELMVFLKRTVDMKRYRDLHSGNIMKNVRGEYKLIDLEGFLLYPLMGPQNNWISHCRTNEGMGAFALTSPSANDNQLEEQV